MRWLPPKLKPRAILSRYRRRNFTRDHDNAERTPRNDNLPSYCYEPLKANSDSMRLVKIFPGDWDDEIRCSIATVNLSEEPKFYALSYVWGDPTLDERIACDGAYLQITTNLFDALQHLRDIQPVDSLPWFIDAICINQTNIEERGRQVQIMASIYHAAEHVIAWLGTDTEGGAQPAFQHMRECIEHVQAQYLRASAGAAPTDKNDFQETFDMPADLAILEGIHDIFERAWWDRVWVLQEVAVARRASVVCGHETLTFKTFTYFVIGAIFLSSANSWDSQAMLAFYETAGRVWSAYRPMGTWMSDISFNKSGKLNNPSSGSIGDLLYLSGQRKATKKLDYIYAFLGHPALRTRDGKAPLVPADYAISFDELCRRFTRAAILEKGDWSILRLVQHEHSNTSKQNATWVPNFCFRSYVAPDVYYNAGSSLAVDVTMNDLQMVCRGLEVGLITSPLGPFPYAVEGEFACGAAEFIRLMSLITQFAVPQEQLSIHKGQSHDDFWVVLLGHVILYKKSYPLDMDDPINLAIDDARRMLKTLLRFQSQADTRAATEYTTERPRYDLFPERDRAGEIGGFQDDDYRQFSRLLWNCSNRRVFRTPNGFWGLGPGTLESGDICCVFNGARVPFILHPREGGNTFEFVGECFVPGLMYGEVVGMLERDEVKERTFTIY